MTLRRYYIDDFFGRNLSSVMEGLFVLDLGGNKINKRGLFDIDRLNLRVIYANLSDEKKPDVQADAANLPFEENLFDVVVCSELLEHVHSPESVINEVMRVLKPDGILLLTVPFLVPYHADPCDFGRYTHQYWVRILNASGFCHIHIEKQGNFWSVLLDMIRGYYIHSKNKKGYCSRLLMFVLKEAVLFGRKKNAKMDEAENQNTDIFLWSYTTGYGIRASKQ